ncbi:MAG: hypothetical protein AB1486_10920 [Planctomycetota bacterium]
MCRVPLIIVGSLAGFLVAATASAKTWFVGGPGADFTEIQPAVDAASPGDTILVRPVKLYRKFALAKPVTVKASSGRFELDYNETVVIRDNAGGTTARLGGVEFYI